MDHGPRQGKNRLSTEDNPTQVGREGVPGQRPRRLGGGTEQGGRSLNESGEPAELRPKSPSWTKRDTRPRKTWQSTNPERTRNRTVLPLSSRPKPRAIRDKNVRAPDGEGRPTTAKESHRRLAPRQYSAGSHPTSEAGLSKASLDNLHARRASIPRMRWKRDRCGRRRSLGLKGRGTGTPTKGREGPGTKTSEAKTGR